MTADDDSVEQFTKRLRCLKTTTHKNFVRNDTLDLPRLYHYTNAQGARGIIESNVLRATDTEFMNDGKELDYPRDVCSKVIEEFISASPGKDERELLLRLKEYIRPVDHIMQTNRTYACSFSEKDDDASQWLSYANRTGGVALGFDPHNLTKARPEFLIQIKYELLVQSDQFRQIIESGLDIFRRQKSSSIDIVGMSWLTEIAATLIYPFLAFKSKGWASEKEWRLVSVDEFGKSDVQFRNRKAGLTPFVNLSPCANTRFHGKWPLEHIVLGPASSLHHKSFEWYLDSKRLFPPPKISRSEVALRF